MDGSFSHPGICFGECRCVAHGSLLTRILRKSSPWYCQLGLARDKGKVTGHHLDPPENKALSCGCPPSLWLSSLIARGEEEAYAAHRARRNPTSNAAIEKELREHLDQLAPEQRRRVLDFVRTLAAKRTLGVAGSTLTRFAGAIARDDLDVIGEAIEAGCEQTNLHEW